MSRIARRTLLGATASGTALAALPGTIRHARAQSAPIRIGFTAPLSGPAQISGTPNRIGIEAARDWVNAHGGVLGRQIDLVIRDDRGNPNDAVGLMREFVSDGVNLLTGAMLTATVLAVQPIVPSLNAVYISTGSADDRLTHELYNRNSFTTSSASQARLEAFARIIAGHYPDVTVWGAIFSDIAVGHDSYAAFRVHFTRAYAAIGKQLTFVDPQVTKFGTTDFKNQVSSLLASPAQGLFHNLFGADGITFMQQARTVGLFDKLKLVADQGLEFNVGKVLGRAMLPEDWTMSFGYWQGRPENEEGVALSRIFLDKYNDPYPSGLATFGYAALKGFAAAIQSAGGTDTAKVIEALERVEFQTVRGPARFRAEDHRIIDEIDIVRLGPKATAPFWEVKELVKVPGLSVMGPATPGKKAEL